MSVLRACRLFPMIRVLVRTPSPLIRLLKARYLRCVNQRGALVHLLLKT